MNILVAPELTETEPEGLMEPPVPADAVRVYVFTEVPEEVAEKVADIVWLAVTLLKVYVDTAPTDVPSTVTPAIV